MVRFITLSGFLGAGKPTTIVHAAERLRQTEHRVVVITNDQGTDLVDTTVAQRRLGPVMDGGFCCRFEELADTTERLVGQWDADVVLAESVGSCTFITATVIRPLRRLYGDRFQIAPLTAVVAPAQYRGFERGGARGAVSVLAIPSAFVGLGTGKRQRTSALTQLRPARCDQIRRAFEPGHVVWRSRHRVNIGERNTAR